MNATSLDKKLDEFNVVKPWLKETSISNKEGYSLKCRNLESKFDPNDSKVKERYYLIFKNVTVKVEK